MLKNDGFALLIGVDDYSAYDTSMMKPRGTTDLPGSRNDVIAYYRVLRRLGFRPENIRALTSPRPAPSALEGALAENLGAATESGILEGFAWLCERMRGASPSPSDSSATGVFAYSGHGDFLEGEGLVLCPSDILGPTLQRAIRIDALQDLVARYGVGANLTVILDACHSGGAPGEGRRVRSLTGRRMPAALKDRRPVVGDRVLAATTSDGLAFQGTFSGVAQGAFTFALGAVMDQWQAVQDGATSVRLDVSYGELIKRAGALLATLSFEQTPTLHGPGDVAELSVFQRGARPEPTVSVPDATRPEIQVDSGNKNYEIYSLTYKSNTATDPVTLNGEIISVGSKSYTYSGHTIGSNNEYWNIDSNFARNVMAGVIGSTLVFTPQTSANFPASGSVPEFPASGTVTTVQFYEHVENWAKIRTPPSSVFMDAGGREPTSGIAVAFDLSYDDANGTWSGKTTWYAIGQSTPDKTVVPASSTTTLTYTADAAPTPAEGYSWYMAGKSVQGTVAFPYKKG